MLREPLHIISIFLVKHDSLEFDKVLNKILPRSQMFRAFIYQLQSLLGLFDKVIFGVLIEAVDKLYEILFN